MALSVKGINLITLYYTDPITSKLPNLCIKKVKLKMFQEMLAEVLEWEIKPKFVTGDIAFFD